MRKLSKVDFAVGWKIIFWLTLALLITFTITPRGYAQALESEEMSSDSGDTLTFPYKKKFTISSYYTPLPGQSRYFTGSYEGDVRLNGEGVTAADGTKVYPGMAAAPKTFRFGTKMEIPGFGVVAIHDRGGAIKNNRLDIWVGAGEEGLRRAIAWGMRTLEVTVYGMDPSVVEAVNIPSMPLADLSWIIKKTEYFKSDLSVGDEGEPVNELQRFLKKLGYFDAEATGYYGNETQEAVTKFQLSEKVIDSTDDPGKGNFGPKSRIALERLLIQEKNKALGDMPNEILKRGDEGKKVAQLQSVLKEYNYLNEVTEKFDQKTYEGLIRFQLDFGVIKDKNEKGAGYFGAKTVTALKRLIADNLTPQTSLTITSQPNADVKTFPKTLALADQGSDVRLLQEELKRLNFLSLEPTGYFGKTTEHALFKFQQSFGIVESESSDGAGVFGPKTIDKLNEIASARSSQKKLIAKTTDDKLIVAQRLNDEKQLVAQLEREAFAADMIYGSRGQDVERLQKVLQKLGFFQGKLTTAYFGDVTKGSLIAFQKNHGLNESGVLDGRTRRILNSIISPGLSS